MLYTKKAYVGNAIKLVDRLAGTYSRVMCTIGKFSITNEFTILSFCFTSQNVPSFNDSRCDRRRSNPERLKSTSLLAGALTDYLIGQLHLSPNSQSSLKELPLTSPMAKQMKRQ